MSGLSLLNYTQTQFRVVCFLGLFPTRRALYLISFSPTQEATSCTYTMPSRKRARESPETSGSESEHDEPDQLEALSKIDKSIASLHRTVSDIAQTQKSDHENATAQVHELLEVIRSEFAEIHQKFSDVEEAAQERYDALQEELAIKNSMLRDEMRYQRVQFRSFLRNLPARLRDDPPPPYFPQFRKLPPEIRNLVWGFTIPRRILVVNDLQKRIDGEEWYEYHFRRRLSPPKTAQVCQESRAVARKTGRLVRIENGKTLWGFYGLGGRFRRMDSAKTQWSWFDPSRDSLLLDISDLTMEFRDALTDVLQITESLTTNMPVISIPTLDQTFFNCKTFPRLRTLEWVEKEHEVAESSNLRLELALFGLDQNDPISVDIDEVKTHRNLLRILRRNGFRGRPAESIMRMTPDDRPWSTLLQRLEQKWLHSQMIWSPIIGPEAPVNSTEWPCEYDEMVNGPCSEWTKAAFARMPTFRRVRLVRSSHWERQYGFHWRDATLSLLGDI